VPRPAFPRNLPEFQRQFATEAACEEYLAACRWPDGFVCPRCAHRRAYRLTVKRRWQCQGCRAQVSLTAGTILHNTKTPLTVWFWAAYLAVTDKRGISALLVQRHLGLRRYETAWMLLHKLRRAMVNTARERLSGVVEMDDTWVGGLQPGIRGSRQLKGRKAAIVLVAVEKRGETSNRIRMAVIPDFKQATILAFVQRHVTPGSAIYTDGLKAYAGLQAAGVSHVPRKQPTKTALHSGARSVVPLADRAIGNLQQWLTGTHHGVSKPQLQVYLDEFVFRHNRRRQPAAAFRTLLGLGSGRAPTPYRKIRGARDMAASC
jgi:transposase-like protein